MQAGRTDRPGYPSQSPPAGCEKNLFLTAGVATEVVGETLTHRTGPCVSVAASVWMPVVPRVTGNRPRGLGVAD
jgi:hypothetical protein